MFVRHIRPGARIDVVEIDPLIVDVAQRLFAFRSDAAMTIHTSDGRAFLEAAPRGTWDLVMLDAFSDTDIPRALTTIEFLGAVHARLTPAEAWCGNLHTSAPEYGSMVATYRAVFDRVHLVQVPGRRQVILVASDRGLDRAALIQAAERFVREVEPGFDLAGVVREGDRSPPTAGSILRDGG